MEYIALLPFIVIYAIIKYLLQLFNLILGIIFIVTIILLLVVSIYDHKFKRKN